MSKRMKLCALALMSAASGALAQEEDFGGDAEATEVEGTEFDSSESAAQERDGEGASDEGGFGASVSSGATDAFADPPADAPETYLVQPGDTLWGLSQRFLNNPWYWPRIWSYNPQLQNPNWIQPGSVIRFYPGPEQTPVQVEDSPAPSADTNMDVDVGEFDDIPLFEVTADLKRALDKIPERNSQQMRREVLVTGEALAGAGQVAHAPEEKELLSALDRVYVQTDEAPRAGEVLHIFREAREVRHPVSRQPLGRVVEVVGTLRIDAVSDHEHLATILESWRDVRRGDRVGRIEGLELARVAERANEAQVQGYVVDSLRDPVSHFGENHLVFLDRGRKDGVTPGNTFTVVRAGDPFTGEVRRMADEDIGRILVLDVSELAATGLVIFSNREVLPGDRIEMRTAAR